MRLLSSGPAGRWPLRRAALTLIAAVAAACSTGAPSQAPSPTASPTPIAAATSFDEYAVGFCAAFESLFRAVGNPDTAEGSELSKGLDAAVVAHDGTVAARLAAEISDELEAGRRHVVFASGWSPAKPVMVELDRVLVAFEAMTAAKAAAAAQTPGAVDPQVAFEQAGGLEAWTAMFEAYRAIGDARPTGVQPCTKVPVIAP